MEQESYPGCVGGIVGLLTFLACWAYAIAAYGWFIGLGLGWLPSFFIAAMAAYLWPLVVLALIGLGILVFSF